MKPSQQKRRLLWRVAAIPIAVLVTLAGWEALYHGPSEPRDLRYLGWKFGIFPLNVDQALDTMVDDPHRDTVVLGKTREELIHRFGFVSSMSDANEYLKYCYNNSPYRGKSTLALRKSNWMVLMENGRAVDLVLAKGC